MTKLRTLLASWPDRDQLVMEVWEDGLHVGEAYWDGEQVVLRWHPSADITLTLDEWQDLLDLARRKLDD